nr:AAA family ATPase [Rhodopirellula europaea]
MHVHTPASLVQGYGGKDGWEQWLKDIEGLPQEVSVIGINDYIFLDGYRRVLEERKRGRLANIDMVLPVVELRLDKFGGSDSKLSRVNFHVLFSPEVTADDIEAQFLSGLARGYSLSPEHLGSPIHWNAVPTRESLVELGERIIASTPSDKIQGNPSPITVGFNNLTVTMQCVQEGLQRHCFEGKTITAVGKGEWADIRWNGASAAEKKHLINDVDLVFTSSESVAHYDRARVKLREAGVNDRLLDCSDAHAFSSSTNKDRIGNFRTWIKSDPTFEGLRQAIIEFDTRVVISDNQPLSPPYRIENARLDFPEDTRLKGKEHEDVFCFRGSHQVAFSPYFTCLIGGRGSGKSTLLNLLHERAFPSDNEFFKRNDLVSSDGPVDVAQCVSIDSTIPLSAIEFLPQNQIERFATDPSRFTPAIFVRIEKLDSQNALKNAEEELDSFAALVRQQIDYRKELQLVRTQHGVATESLRSNTAIVNSFQSEIYQKLNQNLAELTEEKQGLIQWRNLLADLVGSVSHLLDQFDQEPPGQPNAFHARFIAIMEKLKEAKEVNAPTTDTADARIVALESEILEAREKIKAYLQDRGLSDENLSDVGKANEAIANAKSAMPDLERSINTLRERIAEFEFQPSLLEKYESCVTELLKPISEQLRDVSEQVKQIDLRYSYDAASLRDDIISTIAGNLEQKTREGHIANALDGIDLVDLPEQTEILEKLNTNNKVTKRLRDYFSSDHNYNLLQLEIEFQKLDIAKHRRIDVFYDGKPLDSTSFGQRCTAAVVVLLLLGNTPIVIDEPEAHLDSSLIARYLVELIKSVKPNRQIIFATHNANFVVNGDSELIHVLNCDDCNATTFSSTTIENVDRRQELLSLEGGEKAFKRRGQRYRR